MKLLKSFSIMVVVFVMFVVSSVPAFAASEKKINFNGSNYITISNFEEEIMYLRDGWDENPIFTSQTDVTITFNGDDVEVDVSPYSYDTKEFTLDSNKGFTYLPVSGEAENLSFGENSWVVDADSGDQLSFSKEGFYMLSFNQSGEDYKGIFIHIKKSDVTKDANNKKISATPTASNVIVDGKTVSLDVYNIGGYNYFKLRDLATVVNGSDKQFSVGWDGEKNAIKLGSGEAYTPVGGELAVIANPMKKDAIPTNSKIYLDGNEIQLTAYNIGNNNYFKLRDIAELFNIGVTWNSKTNAVGIDTKIDYAD